LEIGVEAVLVRGDSQVAINQSTDEFNCASDMLHPYLLRCRDLMARFRYIQFQWIQRVNNAKANSLAQMASGYIKEEADV
jgi:ribonuclease HI